MSKSGPERSVDRTAPEEYWAQLAEIIREQIEDGTLPPRTKIMTQVELTTRYKVARGTAARATEILLAEGLLRWVKGRGLFTEEPEVIAAWKRKRQAERRKKR